MAGAWIKHYELNEAKNATYPQGDASTEKMIGERPLGWYCVTAWVTRVG